MHAAGLVLASMLSGVAGLNLRRDFGCPSGGMCLTFETIDKPSAPSPATIDSSLGQNGFMLADAVDGIDPDDAKTDKNKDDDYVDNAQKYLVETPVVQAPPPPAKFTVCEEYDQCPSLPLRS